MTRYARTEPGRRENAVAALASGVLAAGVGFVAFYLIRLLQSREQVGELPDAEKSADPDDRAS